MVNLTLERTFDYEAVDEILNDPDIMETISSKPQKEYFKTDRSEKIVYLMASVGGDNAGVLILHLDTECSLKMHANVLVKYRKLYSKSMCNDAVKWVWENTKVNKINCDIPTIYPNVISRAIMSGFRYEGTRTKSFKKNDKIYDVAMLGIERCES